MNCNIQSIVTKIDDLTVILNTHHVDIACVTESWLSSSVPDSAVNINGYTIVRNDRGLNIGPARPRKEKEYITHMLTCLDTVTQRHPSSGIIIIGDCNHMKDNLLKRYRLTQTVKSAPHGTSILDCVYSNISKYYATPTTHSGLGLCQHLSVTCTPLNVKPIIQRL